MLMQAFNLHETVHAITDFERAQSQPLLLYFLLQGLRPLLNVLF